MTFNFFEWRRQDVELSWKSIKIIRSTFDLLRNQKGYKSNTIESIFEGKKGGKNQESIQSSATPDPGYHMGCDKTLMLGFGQEITIDYRNTLADWLSIIQSKTIFTLQKQ